MAYYVYILECADGTLYTGSTPDLDKRLEAHNGTSRGGARYTRGRRPVTLRYSEACADKSAALQREYAVKSLSRSQKQALFA